jgi:hypothetical protein
MSWNELEWKWQEVNELEIETVELEPGMKRKELSLKLKRWNLNLEGMKRNSRLELGTGRTDWELAKPIISGNQGPRTLDGRATFSQPGTVRLDGFGRLWLEWTGGSIVTNQVHCSIQSEPIQIRSALINQKGTASSLCPNSIKLCLLRPKVN